MAIDSEFFPLKMVIFHSYVSLPEGRILTIKTKGELGFKSL